MRFTILKIAMMMMMMMSVLGHPAAANDSIHPEPFSQSQLKRLLRAKIETITEIASNEVILRAVRRQNQQALSPAKIQQLDEEWIRTDDRAPFKISLQQNKVGKYFKSLIEFNTSIYSEAFLTDRRGANVAVYPATSDYWQGDETKWIAAFNDGVGDTHIGAAVFDESSQQTAIQISVPVMDDGEAIGVLTVGIKLTYVQAKYFRLKESSAH